MNPINALNQEFARMVVAVWSDEAAIASRSREQVNRVLGSSQRYKRWWGGFACPLQPTKTQPV